MRNALTLRLRDLALIATVVLASCGGAAPGPPSASGSAVPKSSSVPAEWQQAVADAKKEGTVAVFGPDGTDVQQALTAPFESAYGIKVDFLADQSGQAMVPRLTTERAAGKYLWDIEISGTSQALLVMSPNKMLDPAEPALILPDVKATSTWRGGSLELLGAGREIAITTPIQRGTLFINTNLVKASDFKSYKDLLDPKWKGKILLDDPRRSGPGLATFTFFYLHPDLGPAFIKALGEQQLTPIKDFQQEIDLVGQGKYPILLGGADYLAVARAKQGIPIDIVDPRNLKEGSDTSAVNGAVALMNQAPHPNAARVYLNWLLSKEGQTGFAKAAGYVSARLDVANDWAPAWRVPQPGAIKTYDLQALSARDKVVAAAEEALGK
jgi:iron(III) transport system substrate-binding protein